ncbi:hypothetical protein TcYC6_0059820 [Trypanosoma cruzi]|nr:hypothetical protein TcYC6_0059820 [Trypanosoma cruzi]
MDEDRIASLFLLSIPSVHSSHRPQALCGSGVNTIRNSVSQSDFAINVDHCPPYLGTAAVLFLFSLCMPCAYDAAVCCASPTHVNGERRADCWQPDALANSLDVHCGWRLQRRHMCAYLVPFCRPRHRDRPVKGPFGRKSSANCHVPPFLDPAARYWGCVGLRGRWEGDGVSGAIVSARLCVGDCALVTTVCGRMPLRAAVFSYFSS